VYSDIRGDITPMWKQYLYRGFFIARGHYFIRNNLTYITNRNVHRMHDEHLYTSRFCIGKMYTENIVRIWVPIEYMICIHVCMFPNAGV